MDWKCPCGRTWPESKARCAACGEPRPKSPSAKPAPVQEIPEETGDVALAIFPGREVLPDALRAYGIELGLGTYDAKRRLEVPFPHVVAAGPRGEIDALSRRLTEEGLACGIAPARKIFQPLAPRRITRVASLSETELVGWGPDGTGPGAESVERKIDLASPRLLVVGSFALRSPGADKKLRFAHVWYDRQDRPFELIEKDTKQFDLGRRQQASARANFDLVLDALGDPPARKDYTLYSDAQRVPRTVVASGKLARAEVSSGVPVADVISRLLWIGWALVG